MSTMTAPPRPTPPPTARSVPQKPLAKTQAGPLFSTVKSSLGTKGLFYGTSGIGKTTTATKAPGPVAFFDLENSLGSLAKSQSIKEDLLLVPADDFGEIISKLKSPGWEKIKTIVIDSASVLEEMICDHVIKTVPKEKGGKVSRIEDYGYGSGYRHMFDQAIQLLAEADQHIKAGRNFIILAHEHTSRVPNPAGDDFIRFEPRIYQSDKIQLRAKFKEWADFVAFYSYDIAAEEGKAKGTGSRAIYISERPYFLAKNRFHLDQTFVINSDEDINTFWEAMKCT